MRYVVLVGSALALAGCGTNADLGTPFVSSVNALTAALKAQDNLEIDLLKDFVRKSDQLEYISSDTYSCGDPSDKYIIEAERLYRESGKRFSTKSYAMHSKMAKEERDKNKMLSAIIGYGEIIAGIAKDYKETKELLTSVQTGVDRAKGAITITEAGLILSALSEVIKIAQKINDYSIETSIRAAAIQMKEPLAAAVKKLNDRKSLAGLTAGEAIAFNYWDACARERLRFIRDYFPSLYATGAKREKILASRLKGMDKTSVLDFAKEYGQYLTEREAFITRRPDYSGLLTDIVKKNEALTTLSGKELLDAANNLGTLVIEIPKSTETLRKLRDQAAARKP